MRSGFDYADIIDEITQRALGENTTAADVASARRSIYLVLENWHALSYNTWRVKTQDFAAGDGVVYLPATVDDLLTATLVRQSGGQTSEIVLRRISESEYAAIANKDSSGPPTQFVLRRTEPPTLQLHPKGRTAHVEIIRATYISRPAAFDRSAHTADDLPARWLHALIIGAALDLASKFPERAGDRFTILSATYPVALQMALSNDRQRTSFRWRI